VGLDTGLIKPGYTFFDYGCGRGEDVAALVKGGYEATGWDPYFRPDEPLASADVVNIGYVVNAIADTSERVGALRSAWGLTEKVLVVSARLTDEMRSIGKGRPHGDGFITGNGTFQKFYTQAELRDWVGSILEVEPVAVAPGIFAAFRDDQEANDFVLRTRRRRSVTVRVSRADRLYDEHRETLDLLLEFFSQRGRLPVPGESPVLEEGVQGTDLRSYGRAWQVIRSVTDVDWNEIVELRRGDLLVDLALLKLNRRPNFGALPEVTKADVKSLFGSYKAATAEADALLYSAGDPERVRAAATASPVGKLLPTALYVHNTALSMLPPILRAYEGCARWLVGTVADATLTKLATDKAKVSYLTYPRFDVDPHPALASATYVRIGSLDVDARDYTGSDNPPILHRKETFVAPDYPLYDKFRRLTEQEERFGLYEDDVRVIGNRVGWDERLAQVGVRLRGHRVVRQVRK